MALQVFIVTVITKTDSPFNIIENAPIEIRERLANGTSGSLSLIFSDQAGLNPITQVGFTTDSLGQAQFYAAAADYNAVYDNNGTPVTIAVDVGVTGGILDERFDRLNPDTIQIAVDDDRIQIDDKLRIAGRNSKNDGGSAVWDTVLASGVTTNEIDIVQCVGAPTLAIVERLNIRDAQDQTQKVMAQLEANNEDINILIVGDSTGNESFEWVFLTFEALGDRYTEYTFKWRVWNVGLEDYDAFSTITTGSGAQTVFIHNASIAGEEATFVKGEIYKTITNVNADLCIVSFGHNGLNDPENQRSELAAFTSQMANDYVDRPIILIGQNPLLDSDDMTPKVREFRELAANEGYGFIDVHSAFHAFAVPLGDFYSDNLHPNDKGSHLWKNTVLKAFQTNFRGSSGLPKNNMEQSVLYTAPRFAALNNWDNTNLTITKETASGFYETNTEATKIVSVGAGNLKKVIITNDEIVRWRERWVTLSVRVRVPSGEVDDSGLVALFDGVNTTTSFKGGPRGGDFYWQNVSIKIDSAATALIAFIYTDRGVTGGTVFIDRVTIVTGRSPVDVTPIKGVPFAETDGYNLFGKNPDGLVVVHNSDADGSNFAVVHLSGIDGSPTDDPRSQYSISFGCDLIKCKRRGDSFDRLRINPRTGGFTMGDGTVTPAIVFEPNGNNLIKTDNASIYSDTDNGFDLGLSNKNWRKGFINDLAQQLTTGGAGSAGAGNQHVEIKIDGVIYKVLHDGTV